MGEIRFDTATPFQPADSSSAETVTFKMGDTLQKIADDNGVDLKDMMAANHLTDINAILPGQEIRIPKKNYAATEPAGATGSGSQQVASAPGAGSVDAKSWAELKMRQATVDGLVQKAASVGVGPTDIAIIASVNGLPTAQFNRATSAIQRALMSSDPKGAISELAPRIVQGSGDSIVVGSTSTMARATGFTTTSFAPGSLQGVDEVTVVAHGNEQSIQIGSKIFSPKELAEALRDSGWKGGTLRLAACDTGSANATFAKNLATELDSLGMDSAVIAAKGPVVVANNTGLPLVIDEATSKAMPAGKGWEIYTAEGESGAARVAGGIMDGLTSGLMIDAAVRTITNYFGSFAAARDAIKSESYADGFAQGLAAGVSGVPQGSVRQKLGIEVADPSTTDRQLDAEGLPERYHNMGLVQGYKFFQSLPPDQQKKLRDDLAAQGNNVRSQDIDNVMHLENALLPKVKEMFAKARQEEAEEQERKRREAHDWIGNKI